MMSWLSSLMSMLCNVIRGKEDKRLRWQPECWLLYWTGLKVHIYISERASLRASINSCDMPASFITIVSRKFLWTNVLGAEISVASREWDLAFEFNIGDLFFRGKTFFMVPMPTGGCRGTNLLTDLKPRITEDSLFFESSLVPGLGETGRLEGDAGVHSLEKERTWLEEAYIDINFCCCCWECYIGRFTSSNQRRQSLRQVFISCFHFLQALEIEVQVSNNSRCCPPYYCMRPSKIEPTRNQHQRQRMLGQPCCFWYKHQHSVGRP